METHLRDLESHLNWCWHRYLLRVWRDCGSFNSATDFDRIRIAGEMRAEAEGRNQKWASAGLGKLLDHLISKLDDPNPEVRQDAAIAIGDDCPRDHPAVDVLIERLRSPDQTLHDRTCAAWALGRIKAKAGEILPILFALIEEMKDQPEADQLRNRSAEAIENLTSEMDVLINVAERCLADRDWQCRMRGLFIAERLLKRLPELRDNFLPLIEPLLKDEVEGNRDRAQRILDEFEEDV